MTKIKDSISSQCVMSVLQKRRSDKEPDIWHHFGFESVKELQDAVRLVACVLNVQLGDSDTDINIGNLVKIESPIAEVQAIALPF